MKTRRNNGGIWGYGGRWSDQKQHERVALHKDEE